MYSDDLICSLRLAYDPVSACSKQHKACNQCRVKKVGFAAPMTFEYSTLLTPLQLKCSGGKEGCDRCVASGGVCEYSPSNFRNGQKSSVTNSTSSKQVPSSQIDPRFDGKAHRSGDRVHTQARKYHGITFLAPTAPPLVDSRDFDAGEPWAGVTNDMYGFPVLWQLGSNHYSEYKQGRCFGLDDLTNPTATATATTAAALGCTAMPSPKYGTDDQGYDSYQASNYQNIG
ncbi:hypothetical protein Purlil1_12828 [Purpureocillium lilacinum]|uniref:Zn(2)-C6 fungal-type domain-containing protein n=1 Tax=Purpureocillium lilacinum TaxID=33203 RepID=A0ABR0BFT6_PURLI|nr:hypothetical protein Purlil1_12828 [Purpureocillium lilacinum]